MQIVGFGAQQLSASPQEFQALSLGGSPPVPPAYLYGTPNARVVPVQQTSNGVVPLNLTLRAQDTANAIEALAASASLAGLSSSAPPSPPPLPNALVSNPPVQSAPPNSTAFVGATVPNEQVSAPNVTPPNTPPPPDQPAAVNFTVTTPPPDQTATQAIAQQSIAPQAQAGPPPPPPPFTLSNTGDGHTGTTKGSQSSAAEAAPAPQPASAATSTQATAVSSATLPPAANPSLVQQVVSTVQSLLIGKIYSTPIFSFYA